MHRGRRGINVDLYFKRAVDVQRDKLPEVMDALTSLESLTTPSAYLDIVNDRTNVRARLVELVMGIILCVSAFLVSCVSMGIL